jgi:hypothetical protein
MEMVRQGVEAIKNYQAAGTGHDYLCEAKLLIVGEGRIYPLLWKIVDPD